MWTKKALVSVLLAAGMVGAAAVPLPAAAQASRWDSDGDGIPNNRDRTPYGERFVDSDRDGIPDHRDRTPYGGRRADRDRAGVPHRFDAHPYSAAPSARPEFGTPGQRPRSLAEKAQEAEALERLDNPYNR
jgi:hypothetical protein